MVYKSGAELERRELEYETSQERKRVKEALVGQHKAYITQQKNELNAMVAARDKLSKSVDAAAVKVKDASREMRKHSGAPDYAQYKKAWESSKEEYTSVLDKYNDVKEKCLLKHSQIEKDKSIFKSNLNKAVDKLEREWDGKSEINDAIAESEIEGTGSTAEQTNSETSQQSETEDDSALNTNDNKSGNESAETEDDSALDTGDNKPSNAFLRGVNNGLQSKTLQRDVYARISGKPTGNTLDQQAATAQAQAQNALNESSNRQMEAQNAQQKASRNEFAEAGKIASMQNDAENRQNINNLSAAAGNSAALMRKTNTPDVQTQKNFQAQQQQVANQQREKADVAQDTATEQNGLEKQYRVKSRDLDNNINESNALSVQPETPVEEPKPAEEPEPTPAEEPAPAEEPKPAEEPEEPTPAGNAQHVINGLLGSSKGTDLRAGNAKQDQELYNWAISKGVQPIQPGTQKSTNPDDWEAEFRAKGGPYNDIMDVLRQGRVGEGKDKSRNFTAKDMNQMAKSMTAPNDIKSDSRIKNVEKELSVPKHLADYAIGVLSDLRMKYIKEDYDSSGNISPEDFEFLAERFGGKFKHNDREYDFFNDDDWKDDTDQSVLKAYADNIKNYLYTYKNEATQVDPSIDPNQEHIGPMAQDIEKVNPACIKETPEGVKTVDTGRLAMMNAGAIGDLARQMQSLIDQLKQVGMINEEA